MALITKIQKQWNFLMNRNEKYLGQNIEVSLCTWHLLASRLNLFIAVIWEVHFKGFGTTGGVTKLVSLISYPAKALTRRFDDIAPRKQVVEEGAMRIPTFYTAEISSSDSHMERLSRMQWVIAYIFSVMFGACNILPFRSEEHTSELQSP